MTTRLYIVRHGESQWNVLKKIQGSSNIDLSDDGIKQAYMLAKRLKNEKIDEIYSSDLNRAFNTAEIIANGRNLAVKKSKYLREMDFGDWEGHTSVELEKLYGDNYRSWKINPQATIIDNGETLNEVQKRALNFVNKIIIDNNGDNILLVSHGTTIKSIILGLLNINLSFYPRLKQDNTAINIIDIKDNGLPVLILFNDTCHLRSVVD